MAVPPIVLAWMCLLYDHKMVDSYRMRMAYVLEAAGSWAVSDEELGYQEGLIASKWKQ